MASNSGRNPHFLVNLLTSASKPGLTVTICCGMTGVPTRWRGTSITGTKGKHCVENVVHRCFSSNLVSWNRQALSVMLEEDLHLPVCTARRYKCSFDVLNPNFNFFQFHSIQTHQRMQAVPPVKGIDLEPD